MGNKNYMITVFFQDVTSQEWFAEVICFRTELKQVLDDCHKLVSFFARKEVRAVNELQWSCITPQYFEVPDVVTPVVVVDKQYIENLYVHRMKVDGWYSEADYHDLQDVLNQMVFEHPAVRMEVVEPCPVCEVVNEKLKSDDPQDREWADKARVRTYPPQVGRLASKESNLPFPEETGLTDVEANKLLHEAVNVFEREDDVEEEE